MKKKRIFTESNPPKKRAFENFSNCTFEECFEFGSCNFAGCTFLKGAVLVGCTLTKCQISDGVHAVCTQFLKCELDGGRSSGGDYYQTKIRGAVLENAYLVDCEIENSTLVEPRILDSWADTLEVLEKAEDGLLEAVTTGYCGIVEKYTR